MNFFLFKSNSVAALMQAQICDCVDASIESTLKYSEFNVVPDLPPERGGTVDIIPPEILIKETACDDRLRELILAHRVPTIDTVCKYMLLIREYAQYSVECNIIALIYLNRLTYRTQIPLTMNNWRGLWITSVILAQKIWEDRPLKTSCFSQIVPSFHKSILKDWERRALQMLEYTVQVKPSLYAKYYFELRHLYVEIIGSRKEWKMKPMSRATENKLRMKSKVTMKTRDDMDIETSIPSAPSFWMMPPAKLHR